MINKICDLHSDTLFEVIKNNTTLEAHFGHLSFEKLSEYDSFIYVLALWSDKGLSSDEAFDAFLLGSARLEEELALSELHGYRVRLAHIGADIEKNEACKVSSVVYAVEGGSLLGCKLSRLETLYLKGVRILTLVWSGECALGGAHDNDIGFTEFGCEVIKLCFELGIIPDLSHANARQIDEALNIAAKYNKAVIASHSNSKSAYAHSRNLTDEHYKAIINTGGIVGVSTADIHLADKADIKDFAKHILHYAEIDSHGVCLGCDFDGATPPSGISDVRDIKKLRPILTSHGLNEAVIDNIMYNNARDFLVKNLGQR